MTENKGLAKQVAFLLAARIFVTVFMFFLPAVLARLFPRYEFGLYREFFLVFYGLYMLVQLGMSPTLSSLLPRMKDQATELLSNTVFFHFLMWILCFVTGLVLYYGMPHLFGYDFFHFAVGPNVWENTRAILHYAIVLGFFLGVMTISSIFDNLLIVEQKSKEVVILIVGWDLARGAGILFTAVITKDLQLAFVVMSIVAVIRFLLMYIYLYSNYKISIQHLSWPVFKQQLRLAVPLTIQSIGHTIEVNIDKLIVMFRYTTIHFATYTVGALQIPIVELVFSSITSVILPRLSEYYGENKIAELIDLRNEAIRKSALILMPCFGALFVAREELVICFFSDKYVESIPIFSIYLFIIPTYIFANSVILQAIGHAKYLTITGIFKPMLAVVMVYTSVMLWDMKGAAFGLVSYHYVATWFYLWLSAKALHVKTVELVPFRTLFQITVVVILAMLPSFLLNSLLSNRWILFVAKPVVFTLFLVPLVLFFQVLSVSDWRVIFNGWDNVTERVPWLKKIPFFPNRRKTLGE